MGVPEMIVRVIERERERGREREAFVVRFWGLERRVALTSVGPGEVQ